MEKEPDKNPEKKALYEDEDGRMTVDPRYIPDVTVTITYTEGPFTLLSSKVK